MDARSLALPTFIEGVLRQVATPRKMVVILSQWPSWLVTLIALDIPIQEAYFPANYHCYFKTKNSVYKWKNPLDLLHASIDKEVIYIFLGTVQYVSKLQSWFSGGSSQRLIVSLETQFRGASWSSLTSAKTEGSKLPHDMKLRVVFFANRDCGGATDAVHRFRFGSDIESATLPSPEVGLLLCVRHFLDGGTALPAG